jgi:hypothetical protein
VGGAPLGAVARSAHPKPAKDGELRWFTNVDGKDTEVDGPGPARQRRGQDGDGALAHLHPLTLDDNPDLTQTDDYAARLDALPQELREAYARASSRRA